MLSHSFSVLVTIYSLTAREASAAEPQTIKQVVGQPAAPIANSAACPDLPLTPGTWNALKIDEYLANYSGGQNMTVQDYAFSQQAQNFICGIGEGCHSGQLCNPLTAPAWHVLYATQEWNAVQNSIYTAVGFAVSMVQATAATMVTDLFQPEHKSKLFTLQDIFVTLSGVAFTVALLSFLFVGPATLVIAGALLGALTAGTATVLTGINLRNSWNTIPDGFTRWSNYAYYLAQWQAKVQDQIANMTDTVLQSGISTPQGISGVLKGGTFLTEVQIKPTSEIEDDIKRTMSVRILVDIIRSQGGYVTYGSDPCDGKGPNKAWSGDNVLSSCPNGTMMNIVKAHGKKTVNKWYNARLLASKYNFTTEYLTTQSWECQKKYKSFSYDPYQNATLPSDANAECIVNLPVCDCTSPEIKRLRQKGVTTTVACRTAGKLPI